MEGATLLIVGEGHPSLVGPLTGAAGGLGE